MAILERQALPVTRRGDLRRDPCGRNSSASTFVVWWEPFYGSFTDNEPDRGVSRELGERSVVVTDVQWGAPLADLISAPSRGEASVATSELIDVAVPGGAGPADDGLLIVEAIVATPSLETHPHLSCLPWVLVLLRRWTGVYASLRAAGRGSVTDSSLASESATLTTLAIAADELRDLRSHSDPEARSMMYRLLGSASRDPLIISSLLQWTATERHPLAKGCAVEAVVVAAIRRWPDSDASTLDWIRECARTGTDEIRGRIRHVADGDALVRSHDIATAILGGAGADLPPQGPFRPVEGL
jgi:hypothetical protein